MMRTLPLALALCLGLVARVRADGIFDPPNDVFLSPADPSLALVDPSLVGRVPLAIDDAGYLYFEGATCYHPDDPAGTLRGFRGDNFYDANGSLRGLLGMYLRATEDGSGVEAAFVPSLPDVAQFDPERVRVFRFDCTMLSSDGQGGTGGVRVGGDVKKSQSPLYAESFEARFIKRGQDTFCFATSGIVCIDFSTEPPTPTQLVSPDDLAALFDPGLVEWPDGVEPNTSARASQLLALPDGRIFMLALYGVIPEFTATPVPAFMAIVERRTDGTLVNRLGPTRATGFDNMGPLAGADTLIYHPGLDAVLAWPVRNNEFNALQWLDGLPGWTGLGFRVLPVDGQGSGYLGVSTALDALLGECDGANGACPAYDAGMFSGELLMAVSPDPETHPDALASELMRVRFDSDRLDLDDDGERAAEEVAAGTSDTHPESDARVPQDDELGTIRYVYSGFSGLYDERVRTVGARGPLCGSGQCVGPDGSVVARYPAERATTGLPATVSADGTFIMLETTEGLVRFHFADGREELAITKQEIDQYVPASEFTKQFVPIDPRRTWILSDGVDHPELYPAKIALVDGDTVTVVYDHERAVGDSELMPAERIDQSIEVFGWNEVTGELQIGVRAIWDTFLLGVGADGEVRRIARGRELAGRNGEHPLYLLNALAIAPPPLPLYLVPTGHGDYFTGGSLMEPYGGFRPSETPSDLVDPPHCAFADVLAEPICVAAGGPLVRYDRAPAPGDVLMMLPAGNADQWALHRSGPRGGVAQLWDAPLEMRDVTGMDLATDGSMRLCVVGGGMLWELEPAGPRGAPEVLRYSEAVPGARDCGYDADGALRVLTRDRELVRPADDDFAALVARDIEREPEPLEYLRKPDGTLELRRRDGLRGKAYLADGRVVSMRESDLVLRVDDVEVLSLPRLVNRSADPSVYVNPDFPAEVSFVVRPDGRVVVVPHHAEFIPPYATGTESYIVDLAQASASFLSPSNPSGGSAGLGLAIVPGGSAADPWTGDLRPPVVVPPGVDPPEVPAPPSGGEAVGAGDGGCSGGAGSGVATLLAGLALAWSRAASGGRRRCGRGRGAGRGQRRCEREAG